MDLWTSAAGSAGRGWWMEKRAGWARWGLTALPAALSPRRPCAQTDRWSAQKPFESDAAAAAAASASEPRFFLCIVPIYIHNQTLPTRWHEFLRFSCFVSVLFLVCFWFVSVVWALKWHYNESQGCGFVTHESAVPVNGLYIKIISHVYCMYCIV